MIYQRGDMVACPYCQAHQGVEVELYVATDRPATSGEDECLECESVFVVEQLGPDTFEVRRRMNG
jgi:uncharacterized protein YbaR (Trm112 family)